MFKHLRPFLLIFSLLLAFGCSSDSGTTSGTAPLPSTPAASNTALFDPAASTIPLPNILATATAKDPLKQYKDSFGSSVARPANKPMDPAEALSYVNIYEMGSTNAVSGLNAPIYIRFAKSVNPATVTAANIKVFQLTPDTAGTENAPLGLTDITPMFTFKYTTGSTDLLLFPNFPLSPASRYLYLVTNRVKDAVSSEPVGASLYFNLLKTETPLTGGFAGLEAIRADVKASNGTDIKLSGYAKVMNDLIAASATSTVSNRSEISLMGRFITTGAGFVSKDAIGTMMPVESALRAFAAGSSLGGLTGKTWTNSATVPPNTATSFATFDRGGVNPSPDAFWSKVLGTTAVPAVAAPATVNSVVMGTINSAQLSMDPVVAKANAASAGGDLSAVTGAYNPAAGVLQPFRDATGALTAYYHTTISVPFVLITPTTPTGKVVIFQHGITGQKEQVVAVAGSLTAAGYTVVAIDQPLHGALAVPGHTTGAQWGQDFMAVGAPLATRSNVQQGAFNLNRLELTMRAGGFAALGITPVAPPARIDIKYVSISLGSIIGSYYLAGNTTLSATGYPYTQTTLSSDMKGFLSVPGGRTAYLLQNSPAFSPSINAGLAAVGIAAGTPTYHQFFLVTQSVVDPVDPATMTTPLAAGLPSRLSGRVAIQEAVGDQVIPNENTRYFGNALGGREVLGAAAAAIAPGFKQLSYITASRIPSSFMYTMTAGAPAPKSAAAALNRSGAATPAEGYFQFDQAGIGHGFLIDNSTPANTALAQSQMVQFLLYGGIIDPTSSPVTAKQVVAEQIPALYNDVRLPPVLTILGY